MSSFTAVMLEEGVEVELPTDLSGVIAILDREVPYFSCEGHGYAVIPGRGALGKRWDMMVKSIDHANRELPPAPLGRMELERLDSNFVQLRFPPRSEQEVREVDRLDRDGRYYGSFIYQTLNALQRHKLIELPGVLPTV